MVIDDYHLAESPPNNRILYDVVNSLDDNVTVVVSSRRKPELALPYFKCQGLLASIDADVLKFSEDESKVLFAGGEHAGAAGSVYRQCSGWPMALQLAKLWLREAAVNTTGSWVIDPQASGITDYLSGAVLEQLPNEVAEMMAETSVLDQGQRGRCQSRNAAVRLLVPHQRPERPGCAHRAHREQGRMVSLPPVDPGVSAGAACAAR